MQNIYIATRLNVQNKIDDDKTNFHNCLQAVSHSALSL